MNTTENEIQTLRKEVDDLRNENIALHNELVKQNKILFEQVISIGKELAKQQKNLYQAIGYFGGGNLHDDLKIHLTRVTAAQSAEFIIKHMPKVTAFDNWGDYFRYVLDKADVSGGGVFGIRRLQRQQHKFYLIDSARQNYLRFRQLRGFTGRLAI